MVLTTPQFWGGQRSAVLFYLFINSYFPSQAKMFIEIHTFIVSGIKWNFIYIKKDFGKLRTWRNSNKPFNMGKLKKNCLRKKVWCNLLVEESFKRENSRFLQIYLLLFFNKVLWKGAWKHRFNFIVIPPQGLEGMEGI